MTQIVEWQEPWYAPDEAPVHVTCLCSIEHAINHAKNIAATRGFQYPSDQMALEDFLTVHWATIKEIQ